jgi:hypothetical protein
MGLFTSLLKTAVNVVILPVAAVSDTLDVIQGNNDPALTPRVLKGVKDNTIDVVDKLI